MAKKSPLLNGLQPAIDPYNLDPGKSDGTYGISMKATDGVKFMTGTQLSTIIGDKATINFLDKCSTTIGPYMSDLKLLNVIPLGASLVLQVPQILFGFEKATFYESSPRDRIKSISRMALGATQVVLPAKLVVRLAVSINTNVLKATSIGHKTEKFYRVEKGIRLKNYTASDEYKEIVATIEEKTKKKEQAIKENKILPLKKKMIGDIYNKLVNETQELNDKIIEINDECEIIAKDKKLLLKELHDTTEKQEALIDEQKEVVADMNLEIKNLNDCISSLEYTIGKLKQKNNTLTELGLASEEVSEKKNIC